MKYSGLEFCTATCDLEPMSQAGAASYVADVLTTGNSNVEATTATEDTSHNNTIQVEIHETNVDREDIVNEIVDIGSTNFTPQSPDPPKSTEEVPVGKRKRRESKDEQGQNKKKLKSLTKAQPKGRRSSTRKKCVDEQTSDSKVNKIKNDINIPEIVDKSIFFDEAFKKLSSQIQTMGHQITQRMDQLEKNLEDKVTKKVTQQLAGMVQTKVKESVKDIKHDMDKEIEKVKTTVTDLKKSFADAVKTVKVTPVTKDTNNLNIVIKNMPVTELEQSDSGYLVNSVYALFRNGLDLKHVKIKQAERKPVRQNDTVKNRPGIVVVTLGSSDQKHDVLSNKRELKNSRDYNKVFIQDESNAETRKHLHNLQILIREMDMSERLGTRIVNGVTTVVRRENTGNTPEHQSYNKRDISMSGGPHGNKNSRFAREDRGFRSYGNNMERGSRNDKTAQHRGRTDEYHRLRDENGRGTRDKRDYTRDESADNGSRYSVDNRVVRNDRDCEWIDNSRRVRNTHSEFRTRNGTDRGMFRENVRGPRDQSDNREQGDNREHCGRNYYKPRSSDKRGFR
ncbi:putative uncharacterized protein DDB_G0281733 [Pecten maximus]|uniref:putative uncharacterized protein DDB_G0281733 n=1 Tax=Pecten maximus TaxID=6579 RepID=UPI001457E843|nr:putative uncharacterized protein DDB_G0281733 [Pecten maximus]